MSKIPSRWLPFVQACAEQLAPASRMGGLAQKLLEEHGAAHKRRLARTLPRRKAAAAGRAAETGARRAVRGAVVSRAGGRCECCGGETSSSAGHLDHFFGRARSELVETCWFLCRACDHRKTTNDPTRRFWLVRFRRHATLHGYGLALQLVQQQLVLDPTPETAP